MVTSFVKLAKKNIQPGTASVQTGKNVSWVTRTSTLGTCSEKALLHSSHQKKKDLVKNIPHMLIVMTIIIKDWFISMSHIRDITWDDKRKLVCKPKTANDGRTVRQVYCGCKSSAGCRWLWRDGLERTCIPKSQCDAPVESIYWGRVSFNFIIRYD